MVSMRTVSSLSKDISRCGVRFTLDGVSQKLGSNRQATVFVPDYGPFTVRAKSSDFDVIRQVFRDRDYHVKSSAYQAAIQKVYRGIIADGGVPVIIDAGANIGAAARCFQKQFPQAAVVAIEPDPENAKLARANCQGVGSIEVVEAALGGVSGFVSIVPADEPWAVQTERSTEGCPVITIADAVARVPKGVLFIAKIDIEGFESDVFKENTQWIDDATVVYLEPHDWLLPEKRTSQSFQSEFGKRDFNILLDGENLIYVKSSLFS